MQDFFASNISLSCHFWHRCKKRIAFSDLPTLAWFPRKVYLLYSTFNVYSGQKKKVNGHEWAKHFFPDARGDVFLSVDIQGVW